MSENLVPKLRFPDHKDDWKHTKISNIADVVGGGTPRTEVEEYWDGNIKWFTPSEIGKSKFISDSERHITNEGLKNSSAKLLPKNTILLSSRATVGEISIALTECSTNQGFQSLITKENSNTNFIYYLISTIKNEFLRRSSGSTFLEISKNEVKKININIPTLTEQKQIAQFFSAIDNKIELLEKKHKEYQEFKKYLLQNIFAQKLRFTNFDDEWKVDKIGNYCKVFGRIGFRGYTVDDLVSEGEGALTIGGKHISPDYKLNLSDPEYLSWEKYDESPEIQVVNGDVLLVKTASVGKVCFIENLNKEATINPQLVVFKNIKINNKYFYYYLTSEFFQKDLNKIKTTTGIPTITQKELLELNMLIPSIKEQDMIVKFLSPVDKKIELLQNQISKTENFKKGLLQQMFI